MDDSRAILHLDMDAFFASVEQRDHPEWRGQPLLVGYDGPRGVVTAASYEARQFGCHSAQPMAIARRMCPHAIIAPIRGSAYHEASRQVFEILESVTPIVEPLSIDEAFLDVTGSIALFGEPTAIAHQLKTRISAEIGLTASVGVAPNKFLAKLASDMDKPDGLTVIPADRINEIIGPLPVERLWGVGQVTAKRLHQHGIMVFRDLIELEDDVLDRLIGGVGAKLKRLAEGRDTRRVTPDNRARSISHEQTFGADLTNPEDARRVLVTQAESVARRLRRHGLMARTVTVKVRFGDFETITRSSTLATPTDHTSTLWDAGRTLFDRWALDRFRPVRLIGFSASQIGEAGETQLSLYHDADDEQQRRLDETTDAISERFGRGSIRRGAGLRPPATEERSP